MKRCPSHGLPSLNESLKYPRPRGVRVTGWGWTPRSVTYPCISSGNGHAGTIQEHHRRKAVKDARTSGVQERAKESYAPVGVLERPRSDEMV
jgi:hypothetical protein